MVKPPPPPAALPSPPPSCGGPAPRGAISPCAAITAPFETPLLTCSTRTLGGTPSCARKDSMSCTCELRVTTATAAPSEAAAQTAESNSASAVCAPTSGEPPDRVEASVRSKSTQSARNPELPTGSPPWLAGLGSVASGLGRGIGRSARARSTRDSTASPSPRTRRHRSQECSSQPKQRRSCGHHIRSAAALALPLLPTARAGFERNCAGLSTEIASTASGAAAAAAGVVAAAEGAAAAVAAGGLQRSSVRRLSA
mmetsp:Transcript_43212/g.106711  ORF Transcript_43212/g.106711 Transcript_43212/m.106711 type:complete len:255 (-) Transcript_43212:740-1504(-)